jgi:hypothetical protein
MPPTRRAGNQTANRPPDVTRGSGPVLHLDLGPLDLQLLGLVAHRDNVVHLDTVVLNQRLVRPG